MTDLALALALVSAPPAISLRGDTLIVRTFSAPSVAHVTYSPGWRRYIEVARYQQSGAAACCMRVIHGDPELFAYHYPRIKAEALQAARWRSYGWGEQHAFPLRWHHTPPMPPGYYRARVCARVPVTVAGRVALRDTCGEWSAWATVR